MIEKAETISEQNMDQKLIFTISD